MAKTFTLKANQLVCAVNSLALMLTLPSLVILCSPISGHAQDEPTPIATSTPVGGEPLCNEEFEIPCVQWEEKVYLDEAKTVQALKMDEEGNFVFGCCPKPPDWLLSVVGNCRIGSWREGCDTPPGCETGTWEKVPGACGGVGTSYAYGPCCENIYDDEGNPTNEMWICKCPDGPAYIGHCNQRLSSLNPTCGGFYPKAPAGSCYIGLECANDPEDKFKTEGYRSGKCGGTVVTCPANNTCLNGTSSCSDPRTCDIPEAAGGGTHSCVFPGLGLCQFETKPGEPIRPITDGRVFGCPESGSDCKTKDGKDGFIKCVEKPCWCQGCINALNIVCKVTCEPIESTPTPTPTSISTVTTTPQATATATSTPINEATVTPTPTVTPTITPTQCEGDYCPCTPKNCTPECENYPNGCKGGSGDDAPKAFLVG